MIRPDRDLRTIHLMRRYLSVSADPPPGLAPLRGRTRLIALVVMLTFSILAGVVFAVLIRWFATPSNTQLSSVLRAQVLTMLGIGELLAVVSVTLHVYELAAPTRFRRRTLAWMIHRMRRRYYCSTINANDYVPKRQWLAAWTRMLRFVGIAIAVYVLAGLLAHAVAFLLGGSGAPLRQIMQAFSPHTMQTGAVLALLCLGAVKAREGDHLRCRSH